MLLSPPVHPLFAQCRVMPHLPANCWFPDHRHIDGPRRHLTCALWKEIATRWSSGTSDNPEQGRRKHPERSRSSTFRPISEPKESEPKGIKVRLGPTLDGKVEIVDGWPVVSFPVQPRGHGDRR